jgi:hypothetical protein
VPLPADAQLDQVEPPKSTDAPIIISAIRPKSQEVNPTVAEAGFDGELHPDAQYHTQLTAADKAEYANFFKNPDKPPSAAMLGLWYHQKTGAYLANAQQIVDAFKQTHKFSTVEKISIPTKHQSAPAAAINHVANAVVGDFGPEVAATLSAVPDAAAHVIGLGGDTTVGQDWANNADMNRAQLEQDSADHPVASLGGELAGAALSAPLAGEGVAAVGGEVIPSAIKAAGGGAVYGAGSAGPGNRAEGALSGAALGSATDVAAPYVVKALTAKPAQTIDEATRTAVQAAQDLGIKIPKFAISDADRAAAGALEQTPFGRGPINAARQAMIGTSEAARTGIASDLGTAAETPSQLGDQALDAAVKSNKARRAAIGDLYQYAQSMSAGAQIQPRQTLSTIDSLLSDEGQKIGGSKVAPVLQSIKDDLGAAGTITVQQARDLRTSLRERLTTEAGSTPSNADRITNQVMSAVNADMKDGLPTDAFATYKQADAAWAQQRGLEDEVLKPFLGRDFDNWGEQVSAKINSDAKGNGTRLARFLAAMPEDEANNVRASLIMGLGKSRDGAQNASGDAFSLSTFLTNWNQLKGARRMIFSGETADALDKLASVAELGKKVEGERNTSRTGGVMSRLLLGGETSGVVVGLFSGHPKEAVLAGMLAGLTAARQYGAAKLLANPDFAKRLASTPLNPKAAAAFWTRPWVKSLQLKNPAIASEIQAFQAAFKAANDNPGAIPAAASDQTDENQANQQP